MNISMHNAQFWGNMMGSKLVDATKDRHQHEYNGAAHSGTVSDTSGYCPVAPGQYIFITSLHTYVHLCPLML